MYRYAALIDRVEGKDANTPVQSYSDILPGRPTSLEHRDPRDDLHTPYDRTTAAFITKPYAMTIMAGEHQTHDYYMTLGQRFADPIQDSCMRKSPRLKNSTRRSMSRLLMPARRGLGNRRIRIGKQCCYEAIGECPLSMRYAGEGYETGKAHKLL
jgi:hypothetical protein